MMIQQSNFQEANALFIRPLGLRSNFSRVGLIFYVLSFYLCKYSESIKYYLQNQVAIIYVCISIQLSFICHLSSIPLYFVNQSKSTYLSPINHLIYICYEFKTAQMHDIVNKMISFFLGKNLTKCFLIYFKSSQNCMK